MYTVQENDSEITPTSDVMIYDGLPQLTWASWKHATSLTKSNRYLEILPPPNSLTTLILKYNSTGESIHHIFTEVYSMETIYSAQGIHTAFSRV